MKTLPQILLALLILAAGGVTAMAIVREEPEIQPQATKLTLPEVSVLTVQPQSLRIDIRSQGSVRAHNEIDLVAEVTGRIIKVSPAFVNGGFFRQDDVLLTVDPLDYDLQIARAKAALQEAERRLIKEETVAEQARKDWQRIGRGPASALTLHKPQLAELRAKLTSAQAELKSAEVLRRRTVIRAPFDGRVRNARVGLGQYVEHGAKLASVYDTERAEIRLPVSTRELGLINLAPKSNPETFPKVTLTALYRGQRQFWHARLVRSEGVIDEKTGMMTLVAEVQDPYGLNGEASKPALPVGLFVEAMIEGHRFDNLISLPAHLVLNNDRIALVDGNNRLQYRTVDIFHRQRERVFIRSGLQPGDRVAALSAVQPAAGVQVNPVNAPAPESSAVAETTLPSAS